MAGEPRVGLLPFLSPSTLSVSRARCPRPGAWTQDSLLGRTDRRGVLSLELLGARRKPQSPPRPRVPTGTRSRAGTGLALASWDQSGLFVNLHSKTDLLGMTGSWPLD